MCACLSLYTTLGPCPLSSRPSSYLSGTSPSCKAKKTSFRQMSKEPQPDTRPNCAAIIEDRIIAAGTMLDSHPEIASGSQTLPASPLEAEQAVGLPVSFHNEAVHTDMEKLVKASNIAVYTPLSAHHTRTMDQFAKVESQVGGIAHLIEQFRQEAEARTDLILRAVQQANEAQSARMKAIEGEMEALRRDVGKSEAAADDSGKAISDRLAGLEMEVHEMAERVKDPGAFRECSSSLLSRLV
ncbi:hypothetical protein OE88DRAFT_467303 [Heliocybe sulcata]|uniref:Uncharacterized protein n=1 Tax=Heliocybe sulcata TaxID=5364 RepID=A0A5C3MUV7_9AGAM|nr:hypothetical protein OE88DRAFT_467303 [Heliocybe sulcata]